MKDIKKIDIHAHCNAFARYAPKYERTGCSMPSPEELIDFYDRLNIERGVLLPIVAPERMYFTMPSENCKYLADTYPERFLWFCNVDPRAYKNTKDSNLGYLLEHYISLGALGIGEITANLYFDDPKMENLFGFASELSLPIMIHIAPKVDGHYGIADEMGLPRLERALKKFPKLKVIGHSQCFWSEISENTEEMREDYPTGKVKEGRVQELLRRYENLYCDLSAGSGANAMMRDREHAARFFSEFSDRIMYGCDLCSASDSETFFEFDEFLSSMRCSGEMSEENYLKIVRTNAEKLLKL